MREVLDKYQVLMSMRAIWITKLDYLNIAENEQLLDPQTMKLIDSKYARETVNTKIGFEYVEQEYLDNRLHSIVCHYSLKENQKKYPYMIEYGINGIPSMDARLHTMKAKMLLFNLHIGQPYVGEKDNDIRTCMFDASKGWYSEGLGLRWHTWLESNITHHLEIEVNDEYDRKDMKWMMETSGVFKLVDGIPDEFEELYQATFPNADSWLKPVLAMKAECGVYCEMVVFYFVLLVYVYDLVRHAVYDVALVKTSSFHMRWWNMVHKWHKRKNMD